MSTLDFQTFGFQASLAMAAYARAVTPGAILDSTKSFQAAGLRESTISSRAFSTLTVVGQFEDSGTGAAMTLFKNGTQYSLAVRGTDIAANDLATDFLLAAGVPASLNPQFIVLEEKLKEWVGTLIPKDAAFTVTGHSLGGYLASALKGAQLDGNPEFNITDAYLFNSPGVGGVFGQLADSYQKAFGFPPPGTSGVWNIQGEQGLRVTAGLGEQLSAPILVWNENGPTFINNHSIVPLTATVTVMGLYQQLFGLLDVTMLNKLDNASGLNVGSTPESMLDALRRVLLSSVEYVPTPTEDPDLFYKNLYALSEKIGSTRASVIYLGDKDAASLISLAAADSADGMAVRHALTVASPFAVSGTGSADEAYAKSPPEYWQARAEMLVRLNWFALHETAAYAPTWNDYQNPNNSVYDNESKAWFDSQTGLNVQRGHLFANTELTYFGKDTAGDTLTGQGMADRLFGRGGNDTLRGGAGDDLLVGGAGDDTLSGGADSDSLRGGSGTDTLYGGAGSDAYFYQSGDGSDVINTGTMASNHSDPVTEGAVDRLIMEGIHSTAVRFTHSGSDLYIEHGTARISISNWYRPDSAGANYRLKEVVFSDRTLGTDELTKLGLKMYGTELGNKLYATDGWENTIEAGGGNDYVYGGTGDDTLKGEAGDDFIIAGGGEDSVHGGTGNDTLSGSAGNDFLVGGAGNDSLYGGSGFDTYFYQSGDGSDVINTGTMASNHSDPVTEGAVDRLIMEGIHSTAVRFTHSGSDLYIEHGTARISISNWYRPDSAGANYRLKEVVFADRTIGTADITELGLTMYGTESGDKLYATPGWDNVLFGLGGNDALNGSTGNDSLFGGGGLNSLNGGAGNDIYFVLGDGSDRVSDVSGYDTVNFGGLELWMVQLIQLGASLEIRLGDVTLARIDEQLASTGPVIEDFVFHDQHYSWQTINSMAVPLI